MHPKVEHYTGGRMPINLSDFIFHSSYVPSQRTGTNTVTVNTGNSVGAGSTATWQSDWQQVGFPIPEIDFTVKVSGTVYQPTTTSSTFRGPVAVLVDQTNYISMRCYVLVNGQAYRCVGQVVNPYNFSISIPARTLTFKVHTFLPPSV